jgi:Xaa-Pro aminopeptidase
MFQPPPETMFDRREMVTRLEAIRGWMKRHGFDAIHATDPANVRYASGFRGEPAALWIDADRAVLATHERSRRWALAQTGTFEVICPGDPVAHFGSSLHGRDRRVGVDQRTPHIALAALRETWNDARVEPVAGIESLRRIKSEAEIECLRRSQRVNERIFEAVLGQIRPGMTERAVQGLILAEMALDESIDGPSFVPIVAAGGNAWEIHHQPDHTPLRAGDMVILDLGVSRAGYASDMTRTICLGEPTDLMVEIHATVGQAQRTAFETLRDGVAASAVDAAARRIIEAAGHGETFTHGLGHGIGLETHDAGLRLSQKSGELTLRAGMVVTLEPGIYLEDRFGVRTEDTVVVRENGAENLTRIPHELIRIPA